MYSFNLALPGLKKPWTVFTLSALLYLLSFIFFFSSVNNLGRSFTNSDSLADKIHFGSRVWRQDDAYGDAIRAIYKPLIKPITNAIYTDSITGQEYNVPSNTFHWKKGLGRELCIIDVDTRNMDTEGQLRYKKFDFSKLQGISSSMLNHYLYAKIHGYDYKFIRSGKWPNKARDDPWVKVPGLREILKSYRIVVFLDADAILRHPELPFEWLLNRWNFTTETSMAMALDVGPYIDAEGNHKHYNTTLNKYGDLNPNSGFIVAQNLPRTFEILDGWISCPDNENDFPGCDHFRHGWPAEQGAFGEHILYKYKRPTDFVRISCDDGMGYPGQGFGCEGKFITHFTTAKNKVRGAVVDTLLQGVLSKARDDFLDDSGHTTVHMNVKIE